MPYVARERNRPLVGEELAAGAMTGAREEGLCCNLSDGRSLQVVG